MELGGDEKRIQALFSELSFDEQSRVPQFGQLWARAHAKKEAGVGSIARPMAIAISLLVTVAACSLAVWTWYRSTETPNIVIQRPPSVTLEVPVPGAIRPERAEPRRQTHIARRRQTDRSIATGATLLSSWQSPTQQFMTSPTDLALGSLPALNQSAKDLESFLSKNSEIMKESNR